MVPVIGVFTAPFVTLKSLTSKVKGPAADVNRWGVLSKSISAPPAIPSFTEPVIVEKKVPLPDVPAGCVNVTNSVNGVLNVLCVAVPGANEKKPSVSVPVPVPIGAMPPEIRHVEAARVERKRTTGAAANRRSGDAGGG